MADSFTKNDRLLGTAGTDADGKKGYYLETLSAGTGATANQVQGNVAHDAVDSGSPVKVGGSASTAPPTAVAVGDRVSAWYSINGVQATFVADRFGTLVAVVTPNVDGVSPSTNNGLVTASLGHAFNGTTWERQRGDVNGTVVQAALSSTFWNYAAASTGIVNTTTAVTIKTAAGASVRNYLKTLTVGNDLLGAATELAIRDGAAGPVLWRGKVQTGATQDRVITFDPPLKGTANTLMEVVTLTASVSGGVFVNATGYTGT